MDQHKVLDRLARARAQLLSAIEGLGQVEMTTLHVTGTWTLHEILAHISGWAAWDLETIKAIWQGEHPDLSVIRDVDDFNRHLVTQRSSSSLDEILAEMQETHVAMQDFLGSIPNRHLFEAGPFSGPYWNTLAEWLQVAWEHEEEHTAQILAWRERRNI